jgi:hypothetical protein
VGALLNALGFDTISMLNVGLPFGYFHLMPMAHTVIVPEQESEWSFAIPVHEVLLSG